MHGDTDIFKILKGNDKSFQKYWFLDSPYITHACFQKNYFDSQNDKMTRKLNFDDDYGIGKIKVKMINRVMHTSKYITYITKT